MAREYDSDAEYYRLPAAAEGEPEGDRTIEVNIATISVRHVWVSRLAHCKTINLRAGASITFTIIGARCGICHPVCISCNRRNDPTNAL